VKPALRHVILQPDRVLRYASHPLAAYEEGLRRVQPVLERHGIAASPLRTAHFLAQVMHESAALRAGEEDLCYSAKRLPQVWTTLFRPVGPFASADYACSKETPDRQANEEKLGNLVYGHLRGNTKSGDGYLFRGRGLLQLTGRYNYQAASDALKNFSPDAPDLCTDPDAACSAQWAFEIAAAFWSSHKCNHLADNNQLDRITHVINGGNEGYQERRIWFTLMTQAVAESSAP
jgi:putative chitinase